MMTNVPNYAIYEVPTSRKIRLNAWWALGAIVAVAVGVLFPPAVIAITVIGITLTVRRAIPVAGFVAVGVLAVLLGIINVGKTVQGDWIWYTEHYKLLNTLPLHEYLGNPVGQYLPSPSEPLYYFVSSVVSRLTAGNIDALALVVTFLIYGCVGAAVVLAAASVTKSPWALVSAAIVGTLMGLTFTLSTQLVRQEIAAALVGLGLVLFGLNKRISASLLLMLSVSAHNSALFPAAAVVLAVLLTDSWDSSRGLLARLIFSAATFYALGWLYLLVSGSNYDGKSDGSIDISVVVMDLTIGAIFTFLVFRRGLIGNRVARTVMMCLPSFYGFVLGVAAQPLPFLRMYFFVEALRALMLAFICVYCMRSRWAAALGIIFICIALTYVELRISVSPFGYDRTLMSLLFTWRF